MARKLQVVEAPVGDIDGLIADFLEDRKAHGLARGSLVAYERNLRRFQAWARDNDIVNVADLDQRAVTRFVTWLQSVRQEGGKPLSPQSVASYARAAKIVLTWGKKQKAGIDPDLDPPVPRVPRKDLSEDVLSRAEMTKLAASATTVRDRVLISLLAETGLRLGEALGLTVDDIDEPKKGDRVIYVRHRSQGGGAKGGSQRTVPVRPRLFMELRSLARHRPKEALTNKLFITDRRMGGEYQALSPRAAQGAVEEAAYRAFGGERRVYPHLLRHSFATDYMRRGGNPVLLQRILGHSSLQMISAVYAHPSRADLNHELMRVLAQGDDE